MASAWVFHNPVRIHFGVGVRRTLLELLQHKRCLVVTSKRGRKQFQSDEILKSLSLNNELEWLDSISSNPDLQELQELIEILKKKSFDAVVGFGGGSSLDAAKALAIGLSQEAKNFNLSQIITSPSQYQYINPLPLYAVPTTAGTGSEVTPFATIWNHEQKKKLSLAGENVFPKAAFVDPELTQYLPLEPTISTGLDAINQAAESLWNKNATPISLSFSIRALQLGFNELPGLAKGAQNLEARSNMAECSLLAGLAISHTRTALCHSISYPLTAHFDVPHGLACAFTMPSVLRLNLQVEDGRFELLKKNLGVESLENLFDELHEVLEVRRRIKQYIPDIGKLLALVNEMYTPGRADNNLNKVDAKTIEEILKAAWV